MRVLEAILAELPACHCTISLTCDDYNDSPTFSSSMYSSLNACEDEEIKIDLIKVSSLTHMPFMNPTCQPS